MATGKTMTVDPHRSGPESRQGVSARGAASTATPCESRPTAISRRGKRNTNCLLTRKTVLSQPKPNGTASTGNRLGNCSSMSTLARALSTTIAAAHVLFIQSAWHRTSTWNDARPRWPCSSRTDASFPFATIRCDDWMNRPKFRPFFSSPPSGALKPRLRTIANPTTVVSCRTL